MTGKNKNVCTKQRLKRGFSVMKLAKFTLVFLVVLLSLTSKMQSVLSEEVKQSTSLTMSAKSEMVIVEQAITISGELKTGLGSPLSNKEVVIEISLNGRDYDPKITVTTAESGWFMTDLAFEVTTNYFIRAIFLGEGDLDSTQSEVIPIIVKKVVSEPIDVPVFAHYHAWWSDSLWDNYLENMTDFPLLGLYHSDEEEVIRSHIDQAIKAGIRGWVISWHYTNLENVGLNLVANYAEERGFSVFIHHNNLMRTGEKRSVDSIIFDLNYLVETYGDNKAFLLYGKPVVVMAQSYLYSNDEMALIVNAFKDNLIILGNENEAVDYTNRNGLFSGNYYYWPSYNPYIYTSASKKLVEISSAVHEVDGALWWAPAAPGYHKFTTGVTVPRNDGLTYIHEVQNTLKSKPDAIIIISWNEWAESTYIEPSAEYGAFYTSLTRDIISGRYGGSDGEPLELNGMDEYYEAKKSPQLSLEQFSLAVWFRTQTNSIDDAMIINKGGLGSDSPGQNLNYGIYIKDGHSVRGGFEASNGTNVYITTSSSETYTDNRWHYAVLTYNGSILELYVDGAKIDAIQSDLLPDFNSTNSLRIGANSRKLDSFFKGSISGIKVWNRSLSELEVLRAYNGLFDKSGLVFEVNHNIKVASSTYDVEDLKLSLISANSLQGIERVEISIDDEDTFRDITSNYVDGKYYYCWGNDSEQGIRLRVIDRSEFRRSMNLLTLSQSGIESPILQITTIPNVSYYPIFINNETYYTDDLGSLSLPKRNGTVYVSVPDVYYIDENKRFVFNRWSPIMPQNFSIDLSAGKSYRFHLGLLQQFKTSLTFTNPNAETINSSLIDSVTLISNKGDLVQSNGIPYEVWLSKNYLISSSQSLRIGDLHYEVYHVIVDGVDVSTNLRRIIPAANKTFDVQCKVYPLSITVSDVFTGRKLQSDIELLNIDSKTTYHIGPNSNNNIGLQYEEEEDTVLTHNLPAGTYLVSIHSAQGFGFPKTVILNKPSAIIVNVLSYSSLGFMVGIPTFLVVLVIVYHKKDARGRFIEIKLLKKVKLSRRL